jgi:hypothetical protein
MTPQEIKDKNKATNGHTNVPKDKVYLTETKCVDGNWAIAHVAYRTNDVDMVTFGQYLQPTK